MAGPPLVAVVGARQLRRTLRKAGDDLTEMRAAHQAVANLVAGAATATAPRRTGLLAGTVRGAGTKTHATIRAGYARVPYAGPIHWGWPARHIRANPWLTTAGASTEPAWFALYTRRVEDILDTVKGA